VLNGRRRSTTNAIPPLDESALKEQVMAGGKIPRHIAFIMDGNGRWAKSRGLPRIIGHRQGVQTVRRMVEIGPEIGVDVMTFYTFSSENWRRPKFEVAALMQLLVESIDRELEDLMKNRVKLRIIGELENLPDEPRRAMERAVIQTSGNDGLVLVLALSYSGRREIARAFNRMVAAGLSNADDELISKYLDTADLPDPDLLIRTSGELRLSNFLLYQLAYTEIVVTDKHWPDFSRVELLECIRQYQGRERRYGLISEQVADVNR